MQYHALSLARKGYDVALVGYRGARCVPDVEANENIRQYFVDPVAGKGLR
jgi:hypothetical protein